MSAVVASISNVASAAALICACAVCHSLVLVGVWCLCGSTALALRDLCEVLGPMVKPMLGQAFVQSVSCRRTKRSTDHWCSKQVDFIALKVAVCCRCASQLCKKSMESGDEGIIEVGQYTTQMVQQLAQTA